MVNAHIRKITAVIALLAAATSLSACGTHSQSASPTLADHSAKTEQTSGNNKASSSSSNTESGTDSTDNETVVCKAAVDSAVKSYQQVKDEIESANINTDRLLAKDPNLAVKWELASEDLTEPDLSCDGATDAATVGKAAAKLKMEYDKKLTEVKDMKSTATKELSVMTDPATLPTDDSLASRIAQAKAVVKATANGGVCNDYLRGILLNVLAASQAMLDSGTATDKEMKAQSYELNRVTEDVRTDTCVPWK